MSESAIKRRMMRALAALPGCKAVKIHGNSYTERGTPDIIGNYHGRAFVIENKVPGEEPTAIQQHRMAEWRAAGAVVLLCVDPAETIREIKGLT